MQRMQIAMKKCKCQKVVLAGAITSWFFKIIQGSQTVV
jgi:hypothetical protein